MRVIYDLAVQPVSLGDLLLFQQTSLVLADEIEFVLTYDPQRQAVPKWMIPLTRVNQRLSQAHVLSHHELRAMKPAVEWPKKTGYMYYECMDILAKAENVPALKACAETTAWARRFLDLNGRVTIQLRKNKDHPRRDTDNRKWLEFLLSHPEERFVIVCAPHEVDEKLSLPNTTYAAVDTDKVAALVAESDIHMGPCSGPVVMRFFAGKPYCVFRDTNKPQKMPCIRVVGDTHHYSFMTEKQVSITTDETVERIESEFQRTIH